MAVRTGIVISELGGVVARLKSFAGLGLGIVPGTGSQWVSWIGLSDLAAIYAWSLETASVSGAINAVVPQPLHYREFARQIASYYGRGTLIAVPAVFLRAVLGQASHVLLDSQRVKPTALLAAGVQFRATTIKQALDS